MNWGGWSEFWAMGGYGLYVWGSYALTAVFVLTELALLAVRRKAARRALNRLAHPGTNPDAGNADGKTLNEAET